MLALMTNETIKENDIPKTDKIADGGWDKQQVSPDTQQVNGELDELKSKVASLYLKFLDQNNKKFFIWFSPALGVSYNPMFKTAKNYLLAKWEPNVKTGVKTIDQFNVLQKNTLQRMYDTKKLDGMQKIIADSSNDEEKLETLKQQIKNGEDPTETKTPEPVKQNQQQHIPQEENKNIAPVLTAAWAGAATGAGVELALDAPNRQKVAQTIDAVLKMDKDKKIKYKMGSRKLENGAIDCSWLVTAIIMKAWCNIVDMDARSMFKKKKLIPQKLEKEADWGIKKTPELAKIATGDVIFRDAMKKDYQWSGGGLTDISREGKSYRIHHVALVKKIDFASGQITIVQSSGSKWVNEEVITLDGVKKQKHQSDLYVAHLDYSWKGNVFGTENAPEQSPVSTPEQLQAAA